MKFIVIVEGFKKGIAAVVGAATRGDKDYSSTGKINIEADQTELTFKAFGGKLGLTSVISDLVVESLNYRFSSGGLATVNAVDLLNVLDSFEMGQDIVFELQRKKGQGKELVISMARDTEQYQTLPCYNDQIVLPVKAKKFEKELKLDKTIFRYGVEKVAFAMGFEKESPQFLHLALMAKKDQISFAAGTGARHALLDLTGDQLVESNPALVSFLLQRDNISTILRVLETAEDNDIIIKESAKQGDTVYQTIIECTPYEIMLVGLDPVLTWIDEQKILGNQYPIKVVTAVADWKLASKGTSATYNEQVRKEKKAHKAFVSMDFAKDIITVKANETMRASRKVPIIDKKIGGNLQICNFASVSVYLREVASSKSEYVQIEAIGKGKPVCVYHHAKDIVSDHSDLTFDDGRGFKERFTVFFGTHAS